MNIINIPTDSSIKALVESESLTVQQKVDAMSKVIPIIKPHIVRDCSLYQKLKQASEELSLAIAAIDIEKAEMELERLSIDIELRQLEQDIANKVIKWDNARGGSDD